MATLNFSRRELLCKIVYYGPGLGGKTTNLQHIHARVPERFRGNLTSIETRGDRTLFFDLLPLEYGKLRGFSIHLQLYTVPGQVFYNASRKIVLKGVDGVVFVADSQAGKMAENIESLKNLCDNLHELGFDIEKLPMVFQFNKRDLEPAYPVNELSLELNHRNLNYFEAVATEGKGVFSTLKSISALVIDDIKSKFEVSIPRPEVRVPPAAAVEEMEAVTVERPSMQPEAVQPTGRMEPAAQRAPVQPSVAVPEVEMKEQVVSSAAESEETMVESEEMEVQVGVDIKPGESFFRKIFFALFKRARAK